MTRIICIFTLFILFFPDESIGYSQSKQRGISEEQRLETFFLGTSQWFVIPNTNSRVKSPGARKPFPNRLEFLRVAISYKFTDHLIVSKTGESFEETIDRFKKILAEIAKESLKFESTLKKDLNDRQKEELTKELIARLRKIVPRRSFPLLWQYEFFVNGSAHYFDRKDIRKDLDISADQLSQMRASAEGSLAEYEKLFENEKSEFWKRVIVKLTPRQRQEFSELIGMNVRYMDEYFKAYDWQEWKIWRGSTSQVPNGAWEDLWDILFKTTANQELVPLSV